MSTDRSTKKKSLETIPDIQTELDKIVAEQDSQIYNVPSKKNYYGHLVLRL